MAKIIFCIFLFFGNLSLYSFGQNAPASINLHQDLQIIPINKNLYIHKSWMTFTEYGRVGSNGLIYIDGQSAILMDTPVNDSLSLLLIDWLRNKKGVSIKGVIINHFHIDCLGGLKAFHQAGIPSYATKKCQKLARKEGANIPQIGFRKKLNLKIESKEVWCRYFGKAHTKDNLVVYIPSEQALFGGCMIKSLEASKGNLNDASVKKWSQTVGKIKNAYPSLEIVVPGHGATGGVDLLDYTIKLFQK